MSSVGMAFTRVNSRETVTAERDLTKRLGDSKESRLFLEGLTIRFFSVGRLNPVAFISDSLDKENSTCPPKLKLARIRTRKSAFLVIQYVQTPSRQ